MRYSHPPDNLLENFHKDTLRVDGFLQRHQRSKPDFVHQLQSFLLGGLRDISSTGKYSNLHDLAVYTLGYAHEETIRLAYMYVRNTATIENIFLYHYRFCNILDGAKSGLTVLPEIMKRDTKRYQKRCPEWKEIGEETRPEINEINVQRPRGMKEFVMDAILTHARNHRDTKLKQVDTAFAETHGLRDPSLMKPWHGAQARARRVKDSNDDVAMKMEAELSRIQEHVEKMREEYKRRIRFNFTSKKIEERQDILRSLARSFAAAPDLDSFLFFSSEEVARLRASYAYIHDLARGPTQFPWDVAMRELGTIKARSLGPSKTVTLGFYERFVLKQSAFRR